MRLAVLALVAVLHTTAALADVTLAVGVGKGAFGSKGTSFERVVAVGYEHHFDNGLFVRPEVGYFLDISGRGLSSFWLAPIVGVEARSKAGFAIHVGCGPGLLQNPDQVLGGHFQFSCEMGLGVRDEHFFVGAAGKHLSSGGTSMPNQGRDFLVIQIGIPVL